MLAVVLGSLLSLGVWRFGVRGSAPSKWLYGLRFSLWSVVPFAFYVGGGLSRLILGIPDSTYGMSLKERLAATLGAYMVGFIFLFPIGVDRGEKILSKAHDSKTPTV